VGGRTPSTSRVVDCHSVEKLGFQLLNRKDMILLQGGTHSVKCWTSVYLGEAAFRVAVYSFPLLGGESGVIALYQGELGLCSCQGQRENWTFVYLGRQAFWCHSLSRRIQLSSPQRGIWCFCSLTEEQWLSCSQEHWEVLGLFVP
jgi:hypothetical protein